MDIWRELGDEQSLARQLHLLPYIDYIEGNDDAARAGFEESLALARRVDEQQLVVGELTNLSSVETRAGNLDRARELCREALALSRELQSAYVLPYCVVNTGGVASVITRTPRASSARARECSTARTRRSTGDGDRVRAAPRPNEERARPQFFLRWDAGYSLDDERAIQAAAAYLA